MKMVEFDIHSILHTQKGRHHAGVQVGGGDKMSTSIMCPLCKKEYAWKRTTFVNRYLEAICPDCLEEEMEARRAEVTE